MKFVFTIITILFCFQAIFANSSHGLRGYRKITSEEEIKKLEEMIEKGTKTALYLAAADNLIDRDAGEKFEVDNVKSVSKLEKGRDDMASYFVVVKTMHESYPDVKVVVGFLIEQAKKDKKLTIKGYKIGADE